MSEEYVLNKPLSFTCPECGGSLSKIDGGPIPRYACHIGHVLTEEAMLEAQAERIERLLTSALAALNERRELCRQMIDEHKSDNRRLQTLMHEATETAEEIRDLLNGRVKKPHLGPINKPHVGYSR